MKTKHTQGEWKIDDTYTKGIKNCYWYNINDSTDRIIAEIKGIHYGIDNSECDANTKLIAAAPELLEALQRFIKFVDNQHLIYESSMIRQARAAIKKATE